jgi:hypothetical protein
VESNGERLNNLVLVAELTQKRLERQLKQQTKEGEAAEERCDGLAVAMASLQVKYDAKCGEFNGMNATNKRLERHLSLRTSEAEAAVVRCDGLTQAINSLQDEFDAKCVQFTDCAAKLKDAEKELTRVRGALVAKCEEVQQVNLRFTTWKSHADKRNRLKKEKIESLTAEGKQLRKDHEAERKAIRLANKIEEEKYREEKRDLVASKVQLTKLQSELEILQEDRDEIVLKLNTEEERVEELCCIRHMDQRLLHVFSDNYSVFFFLTNHGNRHVNGSPFSPTLSPQHKPIFFISQLCFLCLYAIFCLGL